MPAPDDPAYPDARSMPYSYEVTNLERTVEQRLLLRVARALGFSTEILKAPRGLSGIKHGEILLGKQERERHAVLFQSGFERCLSSELPPALSGLSAGMTRDPRPLDVREEATRREVLFSAYDIKALLKQQGWNTDVVYFLNMETPDQRGARLTELLQRALGPSLGHVRVRSQVTGSTHPIKTIPVGDLEQSAVATGAGLIKLSDLQVDELIDLASPADPEIRSPVVEELLMRTGLLYYFKPPIDELMLGTLNQSNLSWSEQELVLSSEVSSAFRHKPSKPTLVTEGDLDDPFAVIAALRSHSYIISYEAEVTRLTEKGDHIVHRFKANPQSWHKKVADVVDLVKRLKGIASWIG